MLTQSKTKTKRTRYFLYPYLQGSRSAKALSLALDGKVLKVEGSKFVPAPHRKVVNWGSSHCPYQGCLNSPSAVAVASNKLAFFSRCVGENAPRVPKWTTSKDAATEEIQGTSKRIVARTVLQGHSGEGIVIVSGEEVDNLPNAPLYVQYISKKEEYRVHVFKGEIIDVQRKVRDPDREPSDWKVRSHSNGFIFVRTRDDGTSYKDALPVDHAEQARKALAVSGLDFGAVDLIVSEKDGLAYVLEVNSAVGLEGSTVQIYAEAIRKHFNS